MKTAGGIAFSALTDETARVGYHTLWENGSATAGFLNVKPFDPTQKADWFSRFYAAAAQNGTPLPDAVYRVGEYFSNSGKSGLPNAADPLDLAGAVKTGQCQPNYHLLSTDGYWNYRLGEIMTGAAIGPADQDNTVPSLANLPGNTGFTPGATFPRPYFEGPTVSNSTLADLAMKYWINDIRPALPDLVKDTVAPWQHVTLYGLSIGAQGNVVYPTGVNAITAGTANWPVPTGGGAVGGPESIDDLWHAAINSRGKFFNAQNPQDLARQHRQCAGRFHGPIGYRYRRRHRRRAVLADQVLSATGPATRLAGGATSANTRSIPIPVRFPSTTSAIPSTRRCGRQRRNSTRRRPLTGWDTNRRIVTINDKTNTAVPFRLDKLSQQQQDSLNAGWVAALVTPTPSAQTVLNFLRGDKSNEGVGTTNFRMRLHVLGDIVYSGAVPVGAPSQPYTDAGNPGYSDVRERQQIAHADGLRRRQRRHAARVRRLDDDQTPARRPGHSFPRRSSVPTTRTTPANFRRARSSSAR